MASGVENRPEPGCAGRVSGIAACAARALLTSAKESAAAAIRRTITCPLKDNCSPSRIPVDKKITSTYQVGVNAHIPRWGGELRAPRLALSNLLLEPLQALHQVACLYRLPPGLDHGHQALTLSGGQRAVAHRFDDDVESLVNAGDS